MVLWASVNAALIGLDFFVILYGIYLAKVTRDYRRHPQVMMLAGALFVAFLLSFLAKILVLGVQELPVWTNPLLGIQPRHILYVHEAVALVTVPLIVATYWFAYKRDFARHRMVARYAWPLWLFESAFGVAEYFILYHT